MAEPPSAAARRNLLQMSKVLQKLVNGAFFCVRGCAPVAATADGSALAAAAGSSFGVKDAHLSAANSWLLEQLPRLDQFIATLTVRVLARAWFHFEQLLRQT